MSNSSLVTYTRISPNRTSPRNHVIDTVTIHCVVGQCSVESLGNVFAPTSRQASSNYGIGYDGKIGLYVEEKDRSWCSDSRTNDHRAITIEVASDTFHPYKVTDAAYNALVDLLVDICKRNPGIGTLKWQANKNLIGQVDKQNMTVHRWFANKSCPGDYLYERHAQIAQEVNRRLSGETVKPAEPTPGVAEAESYTLKEFISDVQKTTGAAVDGIAGPETLSKTPTLSASKNPKHACVRFVQKRLDILGYAEVGDADGIAGPKFTSAVAHYQQDNECVVDGEITSGGDTWQKLLGMACSESKPEASMPKQESYTLKEFITDIQKATGAMVDGIPGPETLSKTPTLSASKNQAHVCVEFVQKRLKVLGYTEVGAADGIAGSKFTSAVAHYQRDNNCVADGEITARNKTWKKLLGLA